MDTILAKGMQAWRKFKGQSNMKTYSNCTTIPDYLQKSWPNSQKSEIQFAIPLRRLERPSIRSLVVWSRIRDVLSYGRLPVVVEDP